MQPKSADPPAQQSKAGLLTLGTVQQQARRKARSLA
jgi:hypothetical protein